MLRIRAVALAVALAVMAGGAGAATAQEPAGTEWLQLADQAAAEVASSYPFVERAGQNIRVWWISPLAWQFRTWRDFTRANYRWDLDAWTYSQSQTTRQYAWHNAANADLVVHDCAEITPRLPANARAHAFVPYSTQRQRVDTRSRWAYMALRVHRTCSG